MPIRNCNIGKKVTIYHPSLVNLFECTIGDGCKIGAFVEIGFGVIIGKNCIIGSRVLIPQGVELKNNVFVGVGTTFTNDRRNFPAPKEKWVPELILVEDDVSIGVGCIILPGITLHKGCQIGAGSVVTYSIPAGVLAYGVPARIRSTGKDGDESCLSFPI